MMVAEIDAIKMGLTDIGLDPDQARLMEHKEDDVTFVSWRTVDAAFSNFCGKAQLLYALRTYGPNDRVRCARHTHWSDQCDMISVAEALLAPETVCGRP